MCNEKTRKTSEKKEDHFHSAVESTHLFWNQAEIDFLSKKPKQTKDENKTCPHKSKTV